MEDKVFKRPSRVRGKYVSCYNKECSNVTWVIPSKEKLNKTKTFYCSDKCFRKMFGSLRIGYHHSEQTKQKIREKRKKQVIPKEVYRQNGIKTSGERHWNWKGGVIRDGYGYIKVMSKKHPQADRHGYVKEHRLVVERYLKRRLLKQEVVHHINEIKSDNRIENLYLFDSLGQHNGYHHKLRHGHISKITESNIL